MKFELAQRGHAVEIRLEGAIDEHAGESLTLLRRALVGAKQASFDCQSVSMINSTGLRLWSEFLKSMQGTIDYEYRNCSSYFVDYANMSPALVEGASIRSFFVPFRCDACGASTEQLMQRDGLKTSAFAPRRCEACGGTKELETEVASFLQFLKQD